MKQAKYLLFLFSLLIIPLIFSEKMLGDEIYLRGEINNWNVTPSYKFEKAEGYDIYFLYLNKLSGSFKIADKNWQDINFGGFAKDSDKECEVTIGEWPCVVIGSNFHIKNITDISLILDLTHPACPMLTIQKGIYTPPVPPESKQKNSKYYLKGTLHGRNWESDQSLRFTFTEEENVYTLYVPELYGDFKISNNDWSENYGCGATSGPDTSIALKRNGQNINAPHLINAILTLDLRNEKNPTLNIVGDRPALEGLPSGIFISFHHDNWEIDEENEFRYIKERNIYKLRRDILRGTFKISSRDGKQFKIGNKNKDSYYSVQPGFIEVDSSDTPFYTLSMTDVDLFLDLSDPLSPSFFIEKDYERMNEWRTGYTTAYIENFDGEAINTERWNFYEGSAPWDGALSEFTNNKNNVEVANSNLRLTAKREQKDGYEFTSAGINSFRKLYYRYGKLDIRMKEPPTSNGLIVALWLCGYHYSWPYCGEIDIIEQGCDHTVLSDKPGGTFFSSVIHSTGSKNTQIDCVATVPHLDDNLQDGNFHLYTMYWDEDRLVMYIDEDKYPEREPYFAASLKIKDPTNRKEMANYMHWPYFIIIHTAVQLLGENTPVNSAQDITALNDSNGNEASTYIDYVKISQKGKENELLFYNCESDSEHNATINDSYYDSNETSPQIYYNLMGVPVTNPRQGIFIKKSGSKTEKIIL